MIKYVISTWDFFSLPKLWIVSLGILDPQEKQMDGFCIVGCVLRDPKEVKERMRENCCPVVLLGKASKQRPPWVKPIIYLIEDKAYLY